MQEGSSLYEFYSDTYFDISLTPNLSHCTSIFGVARELAAVTGQPYRSPVWQVVECEESIEDFLKVRVIDKEDCPRYACRAIKNVKVGPSPDWLKNRLEKCGVRSVNNIVDATNYVLLEMGHPLHAFDYIKLEGQSIVVRKAEEGEILQTLDGKERALKGSMLLIADAKKAAAIAGVMGGADSEIQNQTSSIILESAYFDPMGVRRTAKQLGLQTDASRRFERGTDPNQILACMDLAAAIIQKVAGGEILSGIIDIRAREFSEAIVCCRLSRTNQLLGRAFSRGEVEDVFNRLGFTYKWDGQDQFTVSIPTYRGDIKSEIDLIEEVARIYGYDNIPRIAGKSCFSTLPSAPIYLFESEMRARLVCEGLQEFLTCDLIGPTLLQIVQGPLQLTEGTGGDADASLIKVLNPTSIEQSILRTSLLPGLLQAVKYNFDHESRSVAGFEIGRIHFHDDQQYKEQPVIGIVLTGYAFSPSWCEKLREYDFFDLKGIVENLFTALGVANPHFKNLKLATFHSGRQASIFVDSLEIGSIGEIHPAIQRRLDMPQKILFGEFNLVNLMQLSRPLEKIKPLAIYPSSSRDWTLTIKDSIPYSILFEIIKGQKSPLLDYVSLKDIYRSEKLGAGYQNMTLHFLYRDLSKTIEQDVVEAEHHRLIQAVLEKLAGSIQI